MRGILLIDNEDIGTYLDRWLATSHPGAGVDAHGKAIDLQGELKRISNPSVVIDHDNEWMCECHGPSSAKKPRWLCRDKRGAG